jgi:hypothetical protein
MCFDFRFNFFSKTTLILRRIQRDIVKNIETCSCKVPVILIWLNETPICSTDFQKKKNPKYQFFSNPSSGSRVVPCGPTDGHDTFRKLANALKNGENNGKIKFWMCNTYLKLLPHSGRSVGCFVCSRLVSEHVAFPLVKFSLRNEKQINQSVVNRPFVPYTAHSCAAGAPNVGGGSGSLLQYGFFAPNGCYTDQLKRSSCPLLWSRWWRGERWGQLIRTLTLCERVWVAFLFRKRPAAPCCCRVVDLARVSKMQFCASPPPSQIQLQRNWTNNLFLSRVAVCFSGCIVMF